MPLFFSASLLLLYFALRDSDELMHQFIHIPAFVVTCHVGMQLSPNTTLNLIIIGTVRRKKV